MEIKKKSFNYADSIFTIGQNPIRKIRYFIFLKDVFILSLTAFGGPQAHLAMFLKLLVIKRAYITEEELMELQAFCQVLPGPTSTQTLTAIAFKIGGPNLAYLSLFIWIAPSAIFMTALGISMDYFQDNHISLSFVRFLPAIAIGLVIYAGFNMGQKILTNSTSFLLAFITAAIAFFFQSPFTTPLIIVLGGVITGLKYKNLSKKDIKDKLDINWSNFILFLTVPIIAAIIGAITHWLPVRLFENFYRNGSLLFGGGQVLTSILFTEFVQFKHYLTSEEFLSGWAMVQVAPGPVFSYAAFIGSLSMRNYGTSGEISGSIMAVTGIFLPGTFLIFFVFRFWEQLKQYRIVRASLEGIKAAGVGLTAAASLILLSQLQVNPVNYLIVIITFCLLQFTKANPPLLIIISLICGFFIK